MKQLIFLLLVLSTLACSTSKNIDHSDSKTNKMKKSVLIHTVFFWLKDGTTEKDAAFFEEGLAKLGTCPQMLSFNWGSPAPTEARGVVDNSYNYATSVHFHSLEDQAAYQIEPIHLKFVEDHQDIWDKVVVYDTAVK